VRAVTLRGTDLAAFCQRYIVKEAENTACRPSQ
jgi:hypothetical protein